MKNTIKQTINTADKYSNEYANALYALIKQARFVLGYKFTDEDWADIQQSIVTTLYEKTIPQLNGNNDFAFIRTKVYNLLKDACRSIHRRLQRQVSLELLPYELPANDEFSDEDAIEFVSDILKTGNLDELERKRATKILDSYKQTELNI